LKKMTLCYSIVHYYSSGSCGEDCCDVVTCVDSLEKVHNDVELQNWGSELCKPKEEGGAGLKVSLLVATLSALVTSNVSVALSYARARH